MSAEVNLRMNNYKQKNAGKGKELLIKNYSCSLPKDKNKKFEQLALEDIQLYASNNL
ncbi:MAG: hypothetical protein ICV85_20270 [Tolypothrix sp. T3-bin4]|nr:hypothetical protein [Tolypothrix sp. Co-bin9]MBD0304405.1 hypothetical protein [Tolypothrix sp. T3-bin4]